MISIITKTFLIINKEGLCCVVFFKLNSLKFTYNKIPHTNVKFLKNMISLLTLSLLYFLVASTVRCHHLTKKIEEAGNNFPASFFINFYLLGILPKTHYLILKGIFI